MAEELLVPHCFVIARSSISVHCLSYLGLYSLGSLELRLSYNAITTLKFLDFVPLSFGQLILVFSGESFGFAFASTVHFALSTFCSVLERLNRYGDGYLVDQANDSATSEGAKTLSGSFEDRTGQST